MPYRLLWVKSKLFLSAFFLAGLFLTVLITCNRKQDEGPSKTSDQTPASSSSQQFSQLQANWVNFETGANVKTLALEGNKLWMGLPNGVIRYDIETPDTHVVYTPASTEGGLLSRGIYIIKVDSQSNKWIGTYGGGLTKFDGQIWKTYTMADGLGDQWIYDIVFDQDNIMWVATWKGVSVFDGKGFKNYGEKDGLADKWVYAIALDHDGIFWFGTEAGVSRFDLTKTGRSAWTTFTHKDGLGMAIESSAQPENTEDKVVSAIPTTEDPSDEYESQAGRHHMDPQKRNIKSNPNFIIASVTDQHNNKWFGTWGAGLTSFNGNQWKTYTEEDGLGGNFIHALAVDQEGYLWAGTNGGASWFDGQKWRNFSTKDGLLNNNVFSFAFDSQGRRWFGTWTGLSMYEGELPNPHLP
jgi:ligand-binding sensor domain-containing protein